jgi:hypothetical protein
VVLPSRQIPDEEDATTTTRWLGRRRRGGLCLTIDVHAPAVFSWENVVYCDDTTCPN